MNFVKIYSVPAYTEQGQIYTTYRTLEKIFGKPYFGPGEEHNPPLDYFLHRVTCQWRIKFEDGTVAVIYDDRQKTTNFAPYFWRVGGVSGNAYFLVQELIKNHKINT